MDDERKRGPKPRVSDEEILKIFCQSSDPVLTASEIANDLPIKRRGIYDRLTRLEEEGVLMSKKVGGRTTVWWYPGHTSTPNLDDNGI